MSVSFLEPFETLNTKRKVRENDSELEGEDVKEEKGQEDLQEKESELFKLVKEWIDPLLDLMMDFPHQITNKMLGLRTFIEKALRKDELNESDELLLREAIERVKNDTEDEGISL